MSPLALEGDMSELIMSELILSKTTPWFHHQPGRWPSQPWFHHQPGRWPARKVAAIEKKNGQGFSKGKSIVLVLHCLFKTRRNAAHFSPTTPPRRSLTFHVFIQTQGELIAAHSSSKSTCLGFKTRGNAAHFSPKMLHPNGLCICQMLPIFLQEISMHINFTQKRGKCCPLFSRRKCCPFFSRAEPPKKESRFESKNSWRKMGSISSCKNAKPICMKTSWSKVGSKLL